MNIGLIIITGVKLSEDINAPSPIFNFNKNIPTNGLTDGLHVFHIRFRDSEGKWGSALSNFFQKLPDSNLSEPNDCKIINYEYWVDDEYGNKKSGISYKQRDIQPQFQFRFLKYRIGSACFTYSF